MSVIIEIIKDLITLFPSILEMIKLLKGQPQNVKLEAMSQAHLAVKGHCESVGCAPEPVR